MDLEAMEEAALEVMGVAPDHRYVVATLERKVRAFFGAPILVLEGDGKSGHLSYWPKTLSKTKFHVICTIKAHSRFRFSLQHASSVIATGTSLAKKRFQKPDSIHIFPAEEQNRPSRSLTSCLF